MEEGDLSTEVYEVKEEFLAKNFQKKKKKFTLGIPFKLRAVLAWTIFFAVLGIVIQSIQSGSFVFGDFFGSNYVQWFKKFGSFVSVTEYASPKDLIISIFSGWYYFLYSGGLISLIWEIIESAINSEVDFDPGKMKPKRVKPNVPKIIPNINKSISEQKVAQSR